VVGGGWWMDGMVDRWTDKRADRRTDGQTAPIYVHCALCTQGRVITTRRRRGPCSRAFFFVFFFLLRIMQAHSERECVRARAENRVRKVGGGGRRQLQRRCFAWRGGERGGGRAVQRFRLLLLHVECTALADCPNRQQQKRAHRRRWQQSAASGTHLVGSASGDAAPAAATARSPRSSLLFPLRFLFRGALLFFFFLFSAFPRAVMHTHRRGGGGGMGDATATGPVAPVGEAASRSAFVTRYIDSRRGCGGHVAATRASAPSV